MIKRRKMHVNVIQTPLLPSVPKKINSLMTSFGIPISKDHNGNMYFSVDDKLKNKIPLDYISDEYKTRNDIRKIYLSEMITTMTLKQKISATTKTNMFTLLRFYEAVDRVEIDDRFTVTDHTNLFRSEDKFVFRLIESLKEIFPGIEDRITTQMVIKTIRRDFILDVHIQVTPNTAIGIEFDESHHLTRDNRVSDRSKRNVLSRFVQLRIFREEDEDDFEHFLRAICYDIIKLHNTPETKDMQNLYLANFIAYNIRKMDKKKVNAASIRRIIEISTVDVVDIDELAEDILGTDKDEVRKALRQFIKDGSIREDRIICNNIDGKKHMVGINTLELNVFIMMYNDRRCMPHRVMFSRVFNEYIALTKGDYTKYVFTCSNEDFILSLQEDMLAYSMATIPRTRKIVKNSKLVNTATIKQKKVSKPVHKDNYAVNIGNVDNDADDIDDDMAIDMSLLQDLKNELNANRTEKKNAKKQTDKKKNKKIEPDGESYVEPLDNVDLSEEEEVDDI